VVGARGQRASGERESGRSVGVGERFGTSRCSSRVGMRCVRSRLLSLSAFHCRTPREMRGNNQDIRRNQPRQLQYRWWMIVKWGWGFFIGKWGCNRYKGTGLRRERARVGRYVIHARSLSRSHTVPMEQRQRIHNKVSTMATFYIQHTNTNTHTHTRCTNVGMNKA